MKNIFTIIFCCFTSLSFAQTFQVTVHEPFTGTYIVPNDFSLDSKNNLWVAGTNGGVLKFDGNTWETIDLGNFGGSFITSVAVDNNDDIWLALLFNVWHYDAATDQWEELNTSNSGLNGASLNTVRASPDGSVWFGSSSGLTSLRNGSWNTINANATSFLDDNVSSIAYFNSDKVAITASNYLIRQNEYGSWLSDNMRDYTNASFITARKVASDKDDNLWLATSRGLFQFNGSDIISFEQSIGEISFRQITVDQEGVVWLVDSDGELFYFKDNQLNTVNEDWVPEDINGLLVDQNDKKWILSPDSVIAFNIDFSTSTLEKQTDKLLTVYPTVSKDIVSIKGQHNGLSYSIYNTLGQELTTGKLRSGEQQISLQALSSGWHYIRFNYQNSQWTTEVLKL